MNIEENLEHDIPLAQFTSYRIGGPAKHFIEVDTPEGIVEAIRWAKKNNEKYFILGGGSNILIADKGYNGLIIKNSYQYIYRDGTEMTCSSGLSLARACLSASRHAFSGLEWAAGIPGTIGGAVNGNAGAYGQSMADIVKSVKVYLVDEDKIVEYTNEKCGFAYRYSNFKLGNQVILEVVLQLKKGKTEEILQKMQEYVANRVSKHPKFPSAGSVFKNVPLSELTSVDPDVIEHARSDGAIRNDKLSAAWLIESIYMKGRWVGGARISEVHSNFITNESLKASAEDIIVLMSLIKQKVRVTYGIQLKEEITYLDY
ncbi:UDP-N-acetylmuramate dehydrogenase [Candidatus Falkowbacteria bacterium]|nr:UDP-N-acetylmuramate dehydrogenase [Candidatus Falkowbacteria bacterium]